jgi:hypothetical protein
MYVHDQITFTKLTNFTIVELNAIFLRSVFVNIVFLREGRFAWSSNSLPQCVLLYKVRHVFLFIADVHLLTSSTALQTVRSVLIAVCTGQLAFRMCSLSILNKQILQASLDNIKTMAKAREVSFNFSCHHFVSLGFMRSGIAFKSWLCYF